MVSDDALLPALRQELRLEPVTSVGESLPRWRLYDPLQHRFFLIGEDDVGLLSLWHCGTVKGLRQACAARNSVLDEDLLDGLLCFLRDHHLLQPTGSQALQRLAGQRQQMAGKSMSARVNRLLAFRLPLWNPHRLITFLMPAIDGIGQRSVLIGWSVLTLLGLYLTSRQWDQFVGTFSDFFSPAGFLAYGVALAGLKIWHELGHAYMAVRSGCRVGSMGISIFMGLPMLYTEMSDVARLDNHRQRMWIAAGGVFAETFVAGLATLAWAIFPEGPARSTAFVIATSSWLTSLVINLNPLSRFDGYYFLSDALRIDNLQPRALAYGQWMLGRVLWGAIEPAPEPVSRGRALFFSTYGAGVWLYQITLSCTIAWIAYQTLFKALGVLLLLYTLWHFIGRRLMRVGAHWWRLRNAIAWRRRIVLGGIGGLLLLGLILPLDRRVAIPSVLGWAGEVPVQAPENARIEQLFMQPGVSVQAGELLVRFYSPELDSKRAKAELDLTIATQRLDRVGGDLKDRAETTVLLQQQLQARADLQGLAERSKMLEWRAPQSGLLVDMPASLDAGQWVRPQTTLGRVLHGQAQDVSGFATAGDLARLEQGAEGVFLPEDPSLPSRRVVLQSMETTATEFITPDSLSSRYGGPIATQANAAERSVPVVAQHRVNFLVRDAQGSALPLRLRGQIEVQATPQSLAQQILARLWQLFIIELRN